MNRVKMRGAGTPCISFRNSAITFYGKAPTGLTKCYCWGSQANQPDRMHTLCMGTGYLSGYQRYGYEEFVVSTPSTVTKDAVIVTSQLSGEKDVKFVISSPSVTQATITTERFTLTRCKGFDRFLVADAIDADKNRIKYYYSFDDVNWTEITLTTYTATKLGNRQGTFEVPEDTEYIRFRIVLQKRYPQSPSPRFNAIRFRYRNQFKLTDIDPRYTIDAAAFLACREQQTIEIKQGVQGWETTRPLRWWTLPEVDIKNGDFIKFLEGYMADQYYEVQQIVPHVHGPSTKLLHTSFQSEYIRDANDVVKIIDLLV